MALGWDPEGSERDARVLRWLLEDDQPAVQLRALVDLLDRSDADPAVKRARRRLGRAGWAAEMFRSQNPKGFWEPREPRDMKEWVDFLYFPPYTGTNWRALVLSDLGLDRSDPRIRKVADLLFEYKLRLSSPFNFFHEEVCISANTARMLTRFGYGADRRVGWLFDWLLADQRDDGGWNCSQGTAGTLDAWEALAAFAAVPPRQRSSAMKSSIEKGAEFYLKRRLFREGAAYTPWLRLHYPNHYFYDILVGLELLTRLGFSADRRLDPALQRLLAKRLRDGSWKIDKVHPDVGPGVSVYSDPKKVKPLVIEAAGRPSKWITLQAVSVLRRIDQAR